VAESPALRQKIKKPPTWMAGEGLVSIAHAQQFEIVLLVERDCVVRALPRMHTAGRDGEPEARVGVDALLEIRDADHDVVNARQHSDSSRARDYRMRAELSPARCSTGGVPAVRSLRYPRDAPGFATESRLFPPGRGSGGFAPRPRAKVPN